jgi:hypothetical protein
MCNALIASNFWKQLLIPLTVFIHKFHGRSSLASLCHKPILDLSSFKPIIPCLE